MTETKYIVRVAGKDLDGTKSIENSLRGIKGISHRMARIIANQFKKENSIKEEKKTGELGDGEVKKLEDIVLNPEKHGLPGWAMNRQRDPSTGENTHKTMNELDFSLRTDLQGLAEIKSYRGLRHSWGLTVRGQKTRSTHRGKGGTIGVIRKEAQAKAVKEEKK